MPDRYDVVVIGGGVVGLWAALLAAREGRAVALIERRDRVGAMSSARNSGVLHSGLYYAPGSLKARHCVAGRRLSVAFLREHGVPCDVCGKYIVPAVTPEGGAAASDEPEGMEALENLRARAEENGVEDVALVRADRPFLHPGWALHVGCTGVVDLPAYVAVLEREARRAGAALFPGRTCVAAEPGRVLARREAAGAGERSDEEFRAAGIVNAAGLYADEVAALFGLGGYAVRPNKGSYFRLRAPLPERALVYPLPSPRSTFLGVHYTPDLHGGAWAGPNTGWAADKEDFDPDADRAAFFDGLRRIVRGYTPEDLLPTDRVGLRARLFRHGEPCADFVVEEHPAGVVHLLGIESPGLTAAPALARDALARLGAL